MDILKCRLIKSFGSLQDFLHPLFAAAVFFSSLIGWLIAECICLLWCSFYLVWSFVSWWNVPVQWELCDLVITLNVPDHQLTVNRWKSVNLLFKGHLDAWK